MKEIVWKDVKEFEGVYKVNSLGEVWRIRITGCDTFDKVRKLGTEHRIVILSKATPKGAVEKAFNIKTLIFDCFHNERNHTIKFKDNNPKNLSIDNLIEDLTRLSTNQKIVFSSKILANMRKMKKEGMSPKKIGEVVGCSGKTVRKYLNK